MTVGPPKCGGATCKHDQTGVCIFISLENDATRLQIYDFISLTWGADFCCNAHLFTLTVAHKSDSQVLVPRRACSNRAVSSPSRMVLVLLRRRRRPASITQTLPRDSAAGAFA